MTTQERVLPADVYDALELSALAFGGIGAYVAINGNDEPVCIYGHAQFAGASEPYCPSELSRQLGMCSDIIASRSDQAVVRVRARLGLDDKARVSFADWCKELNVSRGSHDLP